MRRGAERALLAVGVSPSTHNGSPSTADRTGSPLDGENGTVELVVRFDPVDDPAAPGETEGVPAPGTDANESEPGETDGAGADTEDGIPGFGVAAAVVAVAFASLTAVARARTE